MKRGPHTTKLWPVLHRLVAWRPLWSNRRFSSLLPAYSHRTPNCTRVPVAALLQRFQLLHGYDGGHYRLQQLEVNGQNSARCEHGTTETLLEDTLLSAPGALSADKEREHLIISDTKHHRVIIADGDGRVLDCIGSVAGMEDGTFDTAQLCGPASTVFDPDQDCLYIADSENHVIRKADLQGRILGTVCSPKVDNHESSLWEKFLRWIGYAEPRQSEPAELSSKEEDEEAGQSGALKHPWHLRLKEPGLLLVASRWFENLWVLDSDTGEVLEFQSKGSGVLLEEFLAEASEAQEMKDAHSLMFHIIERKDATAANPSRILSRSDLVSRLVRLRNILYFLETGAQIIRRYDVETGSKKVLQLSNLGVLGLPWWWSLSPPDLPSTISVDGSGTFRKSTKEGSDNKFHSFHVQPGRCLLCIDPILPDGMILAAPVQDGSIWRQARGSIVELSVFGGSLISHKISGAQQWIDEFDDLESDDEELRAPQLSQTGLPFYSLVDCTLGVGEVIIDAVFYLKHATSDIYSASLGSRTELVDFNKGTDQQQGPAEGTESQGEGQVFLRHLHITIGLEIASSAAEERTKHIQVRL